MFGWINKKKKAAVQKIVDQLQTMDIIVSSNRTLLDWWIREETISKWGHVFLAGQNKTIYTADWRFKHDDAINYLMTKERFAVYRMPGLTDKQKLAGCVACEKMVGQWYPILNVISLKVQNMINPGSKKLWFDERNFICSQSVAWDYEYELECKLAPQKDYHFTMYTPQDCIDDARLIKVVEYG